MAGHLLRKRTNGAGHLERGNWLIVLDPISIREGSGGRLVGSAGSRFRTKPSALKPLTLDSSLG